jgi:hypothetical protein
MNQICKRSLMILDFRLIGKERGVIPSCVLNSNSHMREKRHWKSMFLQKWELSIETYSFSSVSLLLGSQDYSVM